MAYFIDINTPLNCFTDRGCVCELTYKTWNIQESQTEFSDRKKAETLLVFLPALSV